MDRLRRIPAINTPMGKAGINIYHIKVNTPCYMTQKTESSTLANTFAEFEYVQTYDSINPKHPYEGSEFDLVRTKCYFKDAYIGPGIRNVMYPNIVCSVAKPGGGYINYPTYSSREYLGRVRIGRPNISYANSAFAEAMAAGPDGWNKWKPAKPKVNLSTFIFELREFASLFASAIWKARKLTSKNVSKDFLNYQFGWRPFLNDLGDLIDSYFSINKDIEQLIRDNNKWIRRGGPVSKTYDKGEPKVMSPLIFPIVHKSVSATVRTKSEQRIWFSGMFKYYIPELAQSNNLFRRMRAARRVLGLEGVTPSNIWAVLPFSWLIDWFTNIGNQIENIESTISDNLVTKYAYSMCTLRQRTIHEATLVYDHLGQLTTANAKATLLKESLARAEAHPFGLNFDVDLSIKQSFILAALKLSK